MAQRKGFNFYASYYLVMEDMTDKEKLQFLSALLEREFNGTLPDLKKVSPNVKMAYIGQQHSIDSQVLGFEQKTGEPLTPIYVSTQGGVDGGGIQVQEKGEVKEKVQSILDFESFWNLYDKKMGDKDKLKKQYELISEADRKLILEYIPKYKSSQPDKKYRKNPLTFFNNKSWNDEIVGIKKEVPQVQYSRISMES